MASLEDALKASDTEVSIGEEILTASADEIVARTRLIDNECKILKNEVARLQHENVAMKEKIKENTDKIKLNRQLPYLVGNVVEVLDASKEDVEEEGGAMDADGSNHGKSTVIKTSTRQTVFLPVVGLVDAAKLKPGDLVGVNKDSYLILDTLPPEYDARVKAMEVDEKPRRSTTISED